ncbi:hypothetical protein [Rhodopseudomonas sp. WA056]|uniref:hypothetical protein n=1 Tax=Rhodopseudomonas sp. WA056 TaxID=2269367 RepID=UPI0013DFEE45|nr:hypothetical protein [Rhodopseudomonas sp. WA056]
MDSNGLPWAWITISVTAGASLITAILTAYLTSRFSKSREHEADWRRLKLARYQEFMDAASGLIEGRFTPETVVRFHDSANSIQLVASRPVLEALWDFLDVNACSNPNRNAETSSVALDKLIRAMRRDVRPRVEADPDRQFGFIRPPPNPPIHP